MKKTRKQPADIPETGDVAVAEPASEVLARLVIMATDKGGVGKSYVTQSVVQWLKEHPRQPGFRAFDLDRGPKAILTLCHAKDDRVAGIDITADGELDRVVRVLGEDGVDVSVVDGSGGHFDSTVLEWARYCNLFELGNELGFRITLVLVLDEDSSVVNQAVGLMEEVGNRVDWLLVKSEYNARSFQLWDRSRGADLARTLNAREIKIRRLGDCMKRRYESDRLPIGEVVKRRDCDVMEWNRYGKEWADIAGQFAKVADVLLPAQFQAPAQP